MHMYYSCSFIDVIKSGSHIAPLKVCDGKLEISVYFNLTLWLSKSHADKLRYKFLNFCNLGLFKCLFSLLFWGTQRYLHCPDERPHTPLSQKMLIGGRKSSVSGLWPKKKYLIEKVLCSLQTLMCDYMCLCGLMRGFAKCAENEKCFRSAARLAFLPQDWCYRSKRCFFMQRIVIPDGVVLKRHKNVFHLFICLSEEKEKKC